MIDLDTIHVNPRFHDLAFLHFEWFGVGQARPGIHVDCFAYQTQVHRWVGTINISLVLVRISTCPTPENVADK
jgi:hypothetical protein